MYLNLQTMRDRLSHLEFVRFREESINGRDVVVCCYMLSLDEIWKAPLGVEARGSTFDAKTGELLSLPFEKFFNVNEKAHTQADLVRADMANGFYVAEKLDGSMLTPVATDRGPVLKTKKTAFSDVAVAANLHASQALLDFCESMLDHDMTPMFEYMTPDNQVVLNYGDEPRFVLLAIRCMHSGRYLPYERLVDLSEDYGLEVVPRVAVKDLDELLARVETDEGIEGWVIYTENNRYKIKTRWYCERHNLVDMRYRDLAEHVLNDTLDDLMPNISAVGSEEAVKRVEAVRDQIHAELKSIGHKVLSGVQDAIKIEDMAVRAKWVIAEYPLYQKAILRMARDPDREFDLEGFVRDFYRRQRMSTWSLRSVVNTNFGQGDDE